MGRIPLKINLMIKKMKFLKNLQNLNQLQLTSRRKRRVNSGLDLLSNIFLKKILKNSGDMIRVDSNTHNFLIPSKRWFLQKLFFQTTVSGISWDSQHNRNIKLEVYFDFQLNEALNEKYELLAAYKAKIKIKSQSKLMAQQFFDDDKNEQLFNVSEKDMTKYGLNKLGHTKVSKNIRLEQKWFYFLVSHYQYFEKSRPNSRKTTR